MTRSPGVPSLAELDAEDAFFRGDGPALDADDADGDGNVFHSGGCQPLADLRIAAVRPFDGREFVGVDLDQGDVVTVVDDDCVRVEFPAITQPAAEVVTEFAGFGQNKSVRTDHDAQRNLMTIGTDIDHRAVNLPDDVPESRTDLGPVLELRLGQAVGGGTGGQKSGNDQKNRQDRR